MDVSLFEKLDHAVWHACMARNCPLPTDEAAKNEIRSRVLRVLGIRDSWKPAITILKKSSQDFGDVLVETLRFRSWDGIEGDASLWLPAHVSGPVPAVLFNHGHSMEEGRLYSCYQSMARALSSHGMAFLFWDAVGTGNRQKIGHRDDFRPFACGTTVCGLMCLEAMALFDFLLADQRIDSSRVGIAGHSGGGQNTVFLTALLWEKAAFAVSSGFASSFECGARKERHICECNLFPGILNEFEMYHALGCLSPKPVMISSGLEDPMVPRDFSLAHGHRLATLWPEDKQDAVCAYLWEGNHSWKTPEVFAEVASFMLKAAGLPPCKLETVPEPVLPPGPDGTEEPLSPDCIDLGILAQRLTGKTAPDVKSLADTFARPEFLTKEEFARLTPEMQTIFIQSNVAISGKLKQE